MRNHTNGIEVPKLLAEIRNYNPTQQRQALAWLAGRAPAELREAFNYVDTHQKVGGSNVQVGA